MQNKFSPFSHTTEGEPISHVTLIEYVTRAIELEISQAFHILLL